jgi:hypothetical protein
MKRSYGYETELLGWPGNSNGVAAVLRIRKYDLDAQAANNKSLGGSPGIWRMSVD